MEPSTASALNALSIHAQSNPAVSSLLTALQQALDASTPLSDHTNSRLVVELDISPLPLAQPDLPRMIDSILHMTGASLRDLATAVGVPKSEIARVASSDPSETFATFPSVARLVSLYSHCAAWTEHAEHLLKAFRFFFDSEAPAYRGDDPKEHLRPLMAQAAACGEVAGLQLGQDPELVQIRAEPAALFDTGISRLAIDLLFQPRGRCGPFPDVHTLKMTGHLLEARRGLCFCIGRFAGT